MSRLVSFIFECDLTCEVVSELAGNTEMLPSALERSLEYQVSIGDLSLGVNYLDVHVGALALLEAEL